MSGAGVRFVPAVVAAVASVSFSAAHAASIATPAGLNPGDRFHVVFVTAGVTAATSSGIADYDAFAAAQATAGGVDSYGSQSVTWRALGSTDDVSAISRFNPDVPVFLLDGTKVADNGADLWDGSIDNPLNVDSQGAVASGASVWTGTYSDGSSASGTPPKALGNASVNFGSTADTSGGWVSSFGMPSTDVTTGAAAELPIYAFSSELTVPGAPPAVPVPSASGLGLLAMAMMGLRAAGRKVLRSGAA